jgi:hypothetical protein
MFEDILRGNRDFPDNIDLTNNDHSKLIIDIADSLIASYSRRSEIDSVEREFLCDKYSNLFPLLAIKLARSKTIVSNIKKPLDLSVVFAVYKEHNRIRKNMEHPHGEDFLLKKVRQLEWLCDTSDKVDWKLFIVDDGCPKDSGGIAERIISSNNLEEKVKVLYLKDAIEKGLTPVKSLSSTNDSQKGGSVVYGMWHSVQQRKDNEHIVVYTDADLSTHLGQIGLLIDPILNQGKIAAIGSRREPDSVVIKQQSRNNRGKLFIYLWKRLIPELADIVDTQCGFKAFNGRNIVNLTDDLIEMKFAFDIEILLKAVLQKKGSISKVPIAWIDSEAASTTTDLQPYLPMLKKIAMMYRKYLIPNPTSDEFANFIELLTEEQLDLLIRNIPEGIENREPYEYIDYDRIKVADLNLCLQQ